MRRILRKIAEDDPNSLGDTSTLADPAVVDDLVEHRQNKKSAGGLKRGEGLMRYPGRLAAALIVAAGLGFAAPRAGSGQSRRGLRWPRQDHLQFSAVVPEDSRRMQHLRRGGTCKKAPDFCIPIARPVCGCNGKTYANECELHKAMSPARSSGTLQEVKR